MQEEQKNEVKQVLDKHLMDNRIIHADSEFVETFGPKTSSAKTVTYRNNIDNGTCFVEKNEGLKSTLIEVIAGSLYKTLLYDRSPTFTLVEVSDKSGFDKLKLKSKLLNDFVTLNKFIHSKKQEKLLDLIYEKFSHANADKEELVAYLSYSYSFTTVDSLILNLDIIKKEVKGSEEFIDNIIKQFDDIGKDTKLKKLPIFKDVLTEIFEKFKDDREYISKLFTNSLNYGIGAINSKRAYLLRCYKRYYKEYIDEIIAAVKELAIVYKQLNSILERFDKEEFNEEFVIEIIKEIKNTEGIHEQSNNYANQKLNEEVQGIEKLIVAMMLLGYRDMHGSNIGIMKIRYEDRNGSKITDNVYAKVDMSASFGNLQYTHYFHYINEFKYLLYPNIQHLNIKYDINYSKLKEEINKACDLFTNCEYVESLIHRALFYKKPLLKTEEELSLIEDLAKQIVAQAKLLKEFGNSQEFKTLKEYVISGYDNYIIWALDNNKRIENKHPVVYAVKNKLYIKKFLEKAPAPNKIPNTSWFINPVYWVKYNDTQDLEFLDWMKANENNVHVEELKQLEEFIPPALIYGSKKNIIEKITDAVKANLAQSLESSKNCTVKKLNINCIKDNIQKAR